MKYLKRHEVPFNGFAWDHPLRARWRELGNADPVVSLHPWRYAFRSRNSAQAFTAAMEKLEDAISQPVELSSMELGQLRDGAKAVLMRDASCHIECKQMHRNPNALERVWTRATFSEHFDLFKKFGLIPENATWDPYFK